MTEQDQAGKNQQPGAAGSAPAPHWTSQWRATYRRGEWLVLSGPTSLVVMQPAAPQWSDLINAVWEDVLASASLPDLIARLTEFRLDRMPDFAALFWESGAMRSLVRGRVRLIDPDTGQTIADGEGVRTWSEIGLGDRQLVEVHAGDQTDDEQLELPLVIGAVNASRVLLDATAEMQIRSPQGTFVGDPGAVHRLEADAEPPAAPTGTQPDAAGGPTAPRPDTEHADKGPQPVAGPAAGTGPATGTAAGAGAGTAAGTGAGPAGGAAAAGVGGAGVAGGVAGGAVAGGVAAAAEAAARRAEEPQQGAAGSQSEAPARPADVHAPGSDSPSAPAQSPASGASGPSASELSAEDSSAPGSAADSSAPDSLAPGSSPADSPAAGPTGPAPSPQPSAAPQPGPQPSPPAAQSGPDQAHTAVAPGHPGAPASPSGPPQPPARPVLGVLHPSSGGKVDIDRPVVIGRSPVASRVRSDQLPRLLTVPSPSHDISRTHVQIAPENGRLVVTDLNSTNGTILVLPDGRRADLRPGVGVPVDYGSVIDLGDGVTIAVDRE